MFFDFSVLQMTKRTIYIILIIVDFQAKCKTDSHTEYSDDAIFQVQTEICHTCHGQEGADGQQPAQSGTNKIYVLHGILTSFYVPVL